MQFRTPLFRAILDRRYKRFLADVTLKDGPDAGARVTAHCPNPGAMMGLARSGATVWVSKSESPKRKLAYTYELEEVRSFEAQRYVGINTMHPNKLAEEAIVAGLVPQLASFETLKREQKYGQSSRIDILLETGSGEKTFVEVKNVHLMRRKGHLEFPDCVTARGAKHLKELEAMVEEGHRAVMLFIAQWPGAQTLGVAHDIDPAYGKAMGKALSAGVEALAIDCEVSPEAITPVGQIDFTEQPAD